MQSDPDDIKKVDLARYLIGVPNTNLLLVGETAAYVYIHKL